MMDTEIVRLHKEGDAPSRFAGSLKNIRRDFSSLRVAY